MKSVLILFCLFTIGTPISRIIDLRAYKGTAQQVIDNIEPYSKLYLASNDKAVVLSRITILNGGATSTLDKFISVFNDDGSKKGWAVVNNQISISTTNADNVTEALTGFLFISTAAQASDPNFSVFVVKSTTTIDRYNATQSNLVFLNVQTARNQNTNINQPFYSTKVTEIMQPETTKLYIYRYAPQAGYDDPTDNHTISQRIFMNPVQLAPKAADKKEKFFGNIEPLEIALRVWYLTATGGIVFDVSPDWDDQLKYNTTAVTTTGLISNQMWTYNSTVYFQLNPANDRQTGTIVNCEMIGMGNMTLTLLGSGGAITSIYNKDVSNELSLIAQTPVTEMDVVVSSTTAGIYHIQYFGIDGDPLPSTVSPPSTLPTSMATGSTGSSITVTSTEVYSSTKSVSSIFKFSTVFAICVASVIFCL